MCKYQQELNCSKSYSYIVIDPCNVYSIVSNVRGLALFLGVKYNVLHVWLSTKYRYMPEFTLNGYKVIKKQGVNRYYVRLKRDPEGRRIFLNGDIDYNSPNVEKYKNRK